jgi:hypothetical protein
LCVKNGWYVEAGVSPKDGRCQIPLVGGSDSPGDPANLAMRPAASGGRIVEPETEEDF